MLKFGVKKKNKIRESRTFMTIDYIVMIIFTLLCIIPFINILAMSFSAPGLSVMLLPKKFELYSYVFVLKRVGFYRAFGVSVFVTVTVTISSIVVLALVAYPLSKEHFPFRREFMIFFIIIMLFSGGVIPNYIWYRMIGINNTLLVLILPSIVSVFNLILIKSYFEGLPESIEEAAKIDGAGNIRILFAIVLPMSVPILITVGLFTVVACWNNYQSALYYISSKYRNLYPLALYILDYINTKGTDLLIGSREESEHKDNIQAAMIVLSILPIVIAYPFFLKYFTSGVTLGAVKA